MFRIACVCLFAFSLYGSPLEERLQRAKNGDYLAIEGGKMITVLSIRSLTPSSLVLEEVSIPSQKLQQRPSSWADWIKAKAPGHTSWSMIEIDRSNGEILECYSFSRAAWVQISAQESLIATLLKLPLAPVPDTDRRRIGPPPQAGDPDTRKIWEPPVIFEGKKESIHFDVYRTTWPKDGTEISGHDVLLYFARELRFPFPFWIQIETTHANISLRAIDSGSNLSSPHRSFPRRIPQFIGQPQKIKSGLRLSLKSPRYYRDFEVFAVDVTTRDKQIYPITHSLIKGEEESFTIEIPEDALNQILERDHRYTWLVVPSGHSESYTESAKPFTWPISR